MNKNNIPNNQIKEQKETKNKKIQESYKIWITDEWYIPVDSIGKCIGTCFEGALGFIIKLQHAENNFVRALKIPRLMGETNRENAYISGLMEKELSAVKEVFGQGSNFDGLLNAEVSNQILRGPINTFKGKDEARNWNDSLVFVHYNKGENPQFCLVKNDKENDNISLYPPKSQCPIDSKEKYQILENTIENIKNKWKNILFVTQKQLESSNSDDTNSELEIFSVNNLKSHDQDVWYTSIPSIIYGWAPGTLQEAISRQQRGRWDIRAHFELIERLCGGLDILHRKKMLHADLRPANVVFTDNPENQTSYNLSDYGSFAQTNPHAASDGVSISSGKIIPSGKTVLGPVIGGERTSPFYAPERGLSREREAADIAVVYKQSAGGKYIYLILGWRSEIIDSNTNEPNRENIKNLIDNKLDDNKKDKSKVLLQKGDRIQVREYIFELEEKEKNIDNKQVLICNQRIWKVYQNRIVIMNDTPLNEWEWFPIPRTIELLQWSAATDLFSLGAIALYSVFFNSIDGTQNSIDTTEQDFRQMLTYLSSPPYLNTIWAEIEGLRIELESQIMKDSLSFKEFERIEYKRPRSKGLEQEEESILLKDKVLEVSRLITQTVPGARWLVSAMDYDLGRFIFFIHFVFCCLHRESDLTNKEEWMQILPFCKSRCESPSENGAASKAKKRLKFIRENILGKPILKTLKATKDQIPKFEPRPDTTLRLDIAKLEKEREKLKEVTNRLDTLSALIPGKTIGAINEIKKILKINNDEVLQ